MQKYQSRRLPDVPGSPWQTHQARAIYQNRWMSVTEYAVTRPDGSIGIYGVVDPGDNVTIVALDDEQRVLLVRDFIYPLQEWAWSVPSGAVEPDEDPQQAAQRELAEEGGVTATVWHPLGSFWLSPGISPQTSYCFLATGLHASDALPEPTEVITVQWLPLDEAIAQCKQGVIRHATSLIPLLLVRDILESVP